MANYHPDLDFLIEYAAGTLPLAQSACVAAHLNYCPECQRIAASLMDVGAALFERARANSQACAGVYTAEAV